jgi:hypothetical protein
MYEVIALFWLCEHWDYREIFTLPEQCNDFVHINEPDDGHIRPKYVVHTDSKGKLFCSA